MMESDFKKNLERLMKEKNITQIEFARKIGVSEERMNKIINTDSPLRPLEILNMLIFFDCKQTELFGNLFEGIFDD